MRLKGRDVILRVDNVPVALSRSCSLNISCDMTEVSSFLSGRAKTFVAGRYSWEVSCESLLSFAGSEIDLLECVKNGAKKTISMTADIGGKEVGLTGDVLVASLNVAAPLENMATYTAGLQGTGELHALPL